MNPKAHAIKWELIVSKWFCRKWKCFYQVKKCKWISINMDYSQWKFTNENEENLTQIHQPTWCCINWCDRTQVSGNPQFLFHCLFCLHFISRSSCSSTLLSLSLFLSPSYSLIFSSTFPIDGIQRHRNDFQLQQIFIYLENEKKEDSGSDVNYKCILDTINNFNGSVFITLREVVSIFSQNPHNICLLANNILDFCSHSNFTSNLWLKYIFTDEHSRANVWLVRHVKFMSDTDANNT